MENIIIIVTEKEFTTTWIRTLSEGRLKCFPDDFLEGIQTGTMQLPSINLFMGEEMFGSYELLDSRGNSVIMVNSYPKAKYIMYSNKNKPHSVMIPSDDSAISDVVKSYEKYLDKILRDMEAEYKQQFPKSKNFPAVCNDIFNSLNLKRF